MTNYNPNIDPANNGTLVGTIEFAYQQMIKNTDGMLPATVISYDRTTNRVMVQLLITLVTTDGTQVPRPTVASLPVLVLGGGGFTLSFPLNEGDLGWVMANDRDISLFLQTYAQAQPNTGRVKNFSDGLFIPDIMKTYNVTEANNGYVTLANKNGLASISIGVNPTSMLNEVNIKADVINLIPNATLGFVNIYGQLAVTGPIGATIPPVPPVPFPPG
jgi:hypothetical protein